jgi:hypothetical protein
MRVPSEEELAAIAAAYLAVRPASAEPPKPVSQWRLAARALTAEHATRDGWRSATRVR